MYDLCVIDGKNLAYRTDWIFRNLVSDRGERTGIVFGVLNTLISLKKFFPIKEFVFVWDHKENWRCQKYSWYKDGRKDQPPNEFFAQLDVLQKEVLPVIGVVQLEGKTLEADDVVGMLVKYFLDLSMILVSSDHDWLQLVNERVSLWRPMKKKLYTPKDVFRDFNLTPIQLPVYWSIVGDSTDNIKGIFRFLKTEAWKIASGRIDVSKKWFRVFNENKEIFERNLKLIQLPGKEVTLTGVRGCRDESQFRVLCDRLSLRALSSKFNLL